MFLEKLKSETKDLHDKLEEKKINKNLFSPNASIEDYIDFLKVQYSIWLEVEKELGKLIPKLKEKGIEFSSRTEDITKELLKLNIDIPEQKMQIDPIDDLGSALVYLYLLEGSRHGGMVIIRHIKEFMPQGYEYIFLNTDMEKFSKNWKALMMMVSKLCSEEKPQNDFIEGVSSLYEKIGSFYDKFPAADRM